MKKNLFRRMLSMIIVIGLLFCSVNADELVLVEEELNCVEEVYYDDSFDDSDQSQKENQQNIEYQENDQTYTDEENYGSDELFYEDLEDDGAEADHSSELSFGSDGNLIDKEDINYDIIDFSSDETLFADLSVSDEDLLYKDNEDNVFENRENIEIVEDNIEVFNEELVAEDVSYANTSGVCGHDVRWRIEKDDFSGATFLIISGTGEMYNYDHNDDNTVYTPWNDYYDDIAMIIIEDGVTTLGSLTFFDCWRAESISIPRSVNHIYSEALPFEIFNNIFYAGSKQQWEHIQIDGEIHWIGEPHFYYNILGLNVRNNKCGNNITWSISNETLYLKGSGQMTNYSPEREMAPWLSLSYGIKHIVVGDGITSIGDYAFSDLHFGAEIKMPDSITRIGNSAFKQSSIGAELELPKEVETIGNYAFYDTNISKISFGVKVSEIGASAFAECNNLKESYYNGSEDSWKKITIGKNNEALTNVLHFNENALKKITLEDIDTAVLDEPLHITATFVGSSQPTNITWNSEKGFCHFSGTSVQGPSITRKNDTWWITTTVTFNKTGTDTITVSASGLSDQTIITISDIKDYNYVVFTELGKKDFLGILEKFNKQNPYEYNPELAYCSICLANAAYDDGNIEQNGNIQNTLENFGFDDWDLFQYTKGDYSSEIYPEDTVAAAIAHKKMNNGKTIVFVIIRGSSPDLDWNNMSQDWRSNFFSIDQTWTEKGYHEGFMRASNDVYNRLIQYINDPYHHIDKKNIRFAITGHSRGAAVGNLLEKKLIDNGYLGDVIGYNFACPDVAKQSSKYWADNAINCGIFNINNLTDPVSHLPGGFGYFAQLVGTTIHNMSKETSQHASDIYHANGWDSFWDAFGKAMSDLSDDFHEYGFWGKYGISRWFIVDKPQLKNYGLKLDDHDSKIYIDYLFNKYSIDHYYLKSDNRILFTIGSIYNISIDAAKGLYNLGYKVGTEAKAKIQDKIKEIVSIISGTYASIDCPVDVYAYDEDGQMLGSIVDGIPRYEKGMQNEAFIGVLGEEKIFYFPSTKLRFKIVGTGQGTMDILSINTIDNPFYPVVSTYNDVSVEYAKEFVVDGSDVNDKGLTPLLIVNSIGETVALVNPDGSEENVESHNSTNDTSIRLDKSFVSNFTGESTTLNATVTGPSNTITWSTSDSSVATVKDGKVTGIKAGTVTITAEVNGVTATCVVTVKRPELILSSSSVTLYTGDIYYLMADVFGKDSKVVWKSNNTKVASVDGNGIVKAKKAGKTTIVASANGVSSKCTITVKDRTGISDSKITIGVGDKWTLALYGTSIKSASTDDKKVATVTKKGVVKGIKAGKAKITLKGKNGKLYKCIVTVVKKAGISDSKITIKPGEQKKLNLYGTTIAGTSTDDVNVAIVDYDGTVTAINTGKAKIILTGENGRSYKCIVTVEQKTGINYSRLTLKVGDTAKLILNVTSIKGVSTDDVDVALVEKDGTVKAVGAGKAKIVITGANKKQYKCIVTVEKKKGISNEKLSLSVNQSKVLFLYGTSIKGVSTDDVSVATVSKDGLVTAHGKGKAKIVLTGTDGKSYKCIVMVS